MPMYNLLEYSDNYADSTGSLYQFKRDEQNMNNRNLADVTTDGASSFKYQPSLLGIQMLLLLMLMLVLLLMHF